MIHTLYWPNTDRIIVDNHKRVMNHFGIEVHYHEERIDHGEWMDKVLMTDPDDVVMFFDIDCIPNNRQIVDQTKAWVKENKSFMGISQVSNHIKPCSHIFAAPAFFCIHKEAWSKLLKPSFKALPWADVAEYVSYAAEMAGIRFKTLFPQYFYKRPENERWYLHSYGEYGIGTWFEGGIFHLYQGRMPQNQELFDKVCDTIVTGKQHFLKFEQSRG